MKTLLSIFCGVIILINEALAQDIAPNPLSAVNVRRSYLDIDFNWEIDGKAQAYLNSGITELKNDNLLIAIRDLDEAVKISQYWAAYYYRGVYNKLAGKYYSAEQDFKQAINLNDKCSEALVELGNTYIAKKEFKNADEAFNQALKVDPRQYHGYLGLGNSSLLRDDDKQAIQFYNKSIALKRAFPEAYLMLGITHLKSLENEKSLPYFTQALRIDSTYSEAFLWRGVAYLSIDEPNDCLLDWNKLVMINPDNGFYIYLRGMLHVQLKDYENGFLDLRKALLFNIENEDLFSAKQTILDKRIDLQFAANYLYKTGFGLKDETFDLIKKGFCFLLFDRTKEAIESFKSSIESERSAIAYLFLAISYEHSENHTMAYSFYQEVLTIDNDIFDAHKKRGIYRYELKDWKGAYDDFAEMLRIQPGSIVSYRLMGMAKAHQQDYSGAIIDLTTFLNSDSTDAEVFQTRGACKSYISDFKGAIYDYSRALQIIKKPEYYEAITSYYLILHDTTNALSTLEKYKEYFQYRAYPFLKRIEILIHKNDLVNAKRELKEYTRINAYDYTGLVINLEGLIDHKEGKIKSAIQKFNRAININPENLDARYNRGKAYLRDGNIKKAISDFSFLKKEKFRDSDQILESIKGNSAIDCCSIYSTYTGLNFLGQN